MSDTLKKNTFNKHKEYARKGILESIVYIGNCYNAGEYVNKDETEASFWYEKAAKKGHIESQRYIANRYKYGVGVSQSDKKSSYWLKKASKQNDSQSQAQLGEAYRYGKGVFKSSRKAIKLFKLSANQGDRLGQFHMGVTYHLGLGVKIDLNLAEKWYIKSISQKSFSALTNLGRLYCYGGEKFERNTSKALKCFLEAADKQHSDAQFNLGLMYENGLGVEICENKASEWYTKAADQGHQDAKHNLKRLLTKTNNNTERKVHAIPSGYDEHEPTSPPCSHCFRTDGVKRQCADHGGFCTACGYPTAMRCPICNNLGFSM